MFIEAALPHDGFYAAQMSDFARHCRFERADDRSQRIGLRRGKPPRLPIVPNIILQRQQTVQMVWHEYELIQ